MTTNREWLYSLDVADLSDWFDAEHVDANDDFAAENDISADNVDANDETATCNNSGDFVTHDSREKLEADVLNHVGLVTNRDTVFKWLDRQAEITRKTEQAAWIQQANGLIHEANVERDELRGSLDTAKQLIEQYKADGVDNLRKIDELRNELAKRDKGIERLKRQRDEARQQISKLEAECDELKRKLDIAQRHEERADEECDECRVHFGELLCELEAERDALAADLQDCEQQRERLRQALGCAIDHAHEIMQLVDIEGEVA